MARGRMLNKSVSYNGAVATLVNELGAAAGLVWTWMIAHLDREGRMHGDPAVIKGIVCPRIAGILPEDIRQTAARAAELGLIDWYEVNGESYISFPGFERQQVGMRKDREPESSFPPPDCENSRKIAGRLPEDCRQVSGTLTAEGKGREGNGREYSSERSRAREPAAATPSSPTAITIPLAGEGEHFVTEADVDEWGKAFPGVDILQSLRTAREWCKANPTRRKTARGVRKFLVGWLTRDQDRGGTVQRTHQQQQAAPVVNASNGLKYTCGPYKGMTAEEADALRASQRA